MKALDDSDRERYRLDLLRQVVAERFGPTPWRELHRQPTPLIEVLWVASDSPGEVWRRQRDLVNAMTDANGRTVQLVNRSAA